MFYIINEYPDDEVLVYDSKGWIREITFEVVSKKEIITLGKITKIMGVKNNKLVEWKPQEDAKNKLLGVEKPEYYSDVNGGYVVQDDFIHISKYMPVKNVHEVITKICQEEKGDVNFKYLKFEDTSSLNRLFNGTIFSKAIFEYFDTSKCEYMNEMFQNSVIGELRFGKYFNTAKVKEMKGMFSQFRGSDILDLTQLSSESLRDVSYMFECCTIDEIKLGGKFTLSIVEYMQNMFELGRIRKVDFGDVKLTGIINAEHIFALSDIEIIDASNINIDGVTSIRLNSALYRCYSLSEIIINRKAYNKFKKLVGNTSIREYIGIEKMALDAIIKVV